MMRSLKEKLKYGLLYGIAQSISSLYFFKPFSSNKEELSCSPFFVLGSGRNGSTLLASTLNKYENIHIPPEQFVMPYAIMKFRLLNFLSWHRLKKMIWAEFKKESRTTNWTFRINFFSKDVRSLQGIFDEVYSSSSNKDFKIWGDKTPQNTFFIKKIFPVYPDSKYIFIIRDGRDVVNSLVKMMRINKKQRNFSDKQILLQAVSLWNKSIESYEWLLTQKAQVKLVKYEDFTSNYQGVLSEVISFLEIDAGEFDLSEFQDMGVETMKHHQNLKKPISTASIGKWKKELSEDNLSFILPRIKVNNEKFGYY